MLQNKSYNLEERTAVFGEKVVALCKSLPRDVISTPPIVQFLRAGTSIGANYMEANGASSRKDFIHKMYIAKKEAQETKYWLRILATLFPDQADALRTLWKEAQELTLIFQRIITSAKSKLTSH